MKILWFEITEPSAYKTGGKPIGGWQDSLERIVRTIPEIELTICFVSEIYSEIKVINGVTYVPIHVHWNIIERRVGKYWDKYVKKMLPGATKIVENYKPDLIHIFGTEWPFGQLAAYTSIPIVIHIMGSMVPYYNASYPPRYSFEGQLFKHRWNLIKTFQERFTENYNRNWVQWEKKTWLLVNNYMGRTHWDESLSRVMHPGRRYFHVDEALRAPFLSMERKWEIPKNAKIKLISTGVSGFWKGPDMMLKVAHILTSMGIDFEWNLVGSMNIHVKHTVEEQEGLKFEECNLRILGFKQPHDLIDLLCSSTIYVHTAYIENSPNSICEAQCLGVPVVSTNVGGISTLVRNGVDGVLVAANDPWQMVDAIIQLSADKDRMHYFSENSRKSALERHNDEKIKLQLMDCYRSLIK